MGLITSLYSLNISSEEINEEKQRWMYDDEECEILYRDLICPSCYDNTAEQEALHGRRILR